MSVDAIEPQRAFWNSWNATHREHGVPEVSRRQAEIVEGWLDGLEARDLNIIEVGCGAARFTPRLVRYGAVTATDLSDELLARARERTPEATFIAGDFMALDFGAAPFDAAVTFEVLSHVADQEAFIARIARLLRPGGYLMLATQNRPILQRYNQHIPPPEVGQLRRWFDKRELRDLLQPHFEIGKLFTVTPQGSGGLMRFAQSPKINGMMQRLGIGGPYRSFWEACGFGWTLMVLARRRS